MTAEDLISGALAKPAFAPAGAAAIAVTVFIHEIRIRSGQNGGNKIRPAVVTCIERGAGRVGRQRSLCTAQRVCLFQPSR
jgi:hypothetical protein